MAIHSGLRACLQLRIESYNCRAAFRGLGVKSFRRSTPQSKKRKRTYKITNLDNYKPFNLYTASQAGHRFTNNRQFKNTGLCLKLDNPGPVMGPYGAEEVQVYGST